MALVPPKTLSTNKYKMSDRDYTNQKIIDNFEHYTKLINNGLTQQECLKIGIYEVPYKGRYIKYLDTDIYDCKHLTPDGDCLCSYMDCGKQCKGQFCPTKQALQLIAERRVENE